MTVNSIHVDAPQLEDPVISKGNGCGVDVETTYIMDTSK